VPARCFTFVFCTRRFSFRAAPTQTAPPSTPDRAARAARFQSHGAAAPLTTVSAAEASISAEATLGETEGSDGAQAKAPSAVASTGAASASAARPRRALSTSALERGHRLGPRVTGEAGCKTVAQRAAPTGKKAAASASTAATRGGNSGSAAAVNERKRSAAADSEEGLDGKAEGDSSTDEGPYRDEYVAAREFSSLRTPGQHHTRPNPADEDPAALHAEVSCAHYPKGHDEEGGTL